MNKLIHFTEEDKQRIIKSIPKWECKCLEKRKTELKNRKNKLEKKPCNELFQDGLFPVIYNDCYGGFDTSKEQRIACQFYLNKYGKDKYNIDIDLAYAVCQHYGKSGCSYLNMKWFDLEYLNCINRNEYDGQEYVYIDIEKYIKYEIISLETEKNINIIHKKIKQIKNQNKHNMKILSYRVYCIIDNYLPFGVIRIIHKYL